MNSIVNKWKRVCLNCGRTVHVNVLRGGSGDCPRCGVDAWSRDKSKVDKGAYEPVEVAGETVQKLDYVTVTYTRDGNRKEITGKVNDVDDATIQVGSKDIPTDAVKNIQDPLGGD